MANIEIVRKRRYFSYNFNMAIKRKSIENAILSRIHANGMGWVFSARDFANLGSRSSVDLALHRLDHKGKIQRVIRGIYYYPRSSQLLGEKLRPEVDRVANALARKFGWRTQPGGAMAQNLLGLSTQVPARAVYLSDGPNRTYRVGKIVLIFEHSALKDANFKRPESGLIVQALKALGQNRITPDAIKKIRAWLKPSLRQKVLADTKTATGWVYAAIQEVSRENSNG